MPKKGKKGKKGKKEADAAEPPHDPSWERAVTSGVWDRPVTALPDASVWPTWGALRERVLTAAKEITIKNSLSLRDAFCAEIVKLSPPLLTKADFSSSTHLKQFCLSPATSCPSLQDLNLSHCPNLEYALLQSTSLTTLDISHNDTLTKLLIHCPKLSKIRITNCPQLETLMIWSDDLTILDLTGAKELAKVELTCKSLIEKVIPSMRPPPLPVAPAHPPIRSMIQDNYKDALAVKAERADLERMVAVGNSITPTVACIRQT